MKPFISILMMSSLDGRLHPSRWTSSPDGTTADWNGSYEKLHQQMAGDGWIVGRVTMAEMSKAEAHPPVDHGPVARPVHVADPEAQSYAIAIDPHGRVHFSGPTVTGDHALVCLGPDVSDVHLAELQADGVSYVVSPGQEMDLPAVLEMLGTHFGIKCLALEGGGVVNGQFLAAGLVDEVNILMCPALDGKADADSIASFGDGLKSKLELRFEAVRTLAHGAVLLTYKTGAAK